MDEKIDRFISMETQKKNDIRAFKIEDFLYLKSLSKEQIQSLNTDLSVL